MRDALTIRSIIYSSHAMLTENLRSTYAHVDELKYRTRAACSLLGISDITLKTYVEKSGVDVLRSTRGVPVRLYDINNLFQLTEWRIGKH